MPTFNDLIYGPERSAIARASASTYTPQELARLGLDITLNINNDKNRYVGNPPIYPEIVIWRPDYPGSSSGQAVVVEEIETSGSLSQPRIDDWKTLSSTPGVKFNLLIPTFELERVRQILSTNNISNVIIQTWNLDAYTSNYVFNNNQ